MTTQFFGLELDRRGIGLVLGLAGLSIVATLALYLTSPKISEAQALDQQLTTARQNLELQTQAKNSLLTISEKLNKSQKVFHNLVGLLPQQGDQSLLLLDLNHTVRTAKATLVQFTPGVAVLSTEVAGLSNLSKTTSKVTVGGTFAQQLQVLRGLERLEHLLKIENLNLTPETNQMGNLVMTFDISAYALAGDAMISTSPKPTMTADPRAVPTRTVPTEESTTEQ